MKVAGIVLGRLRLARNTWLGRSGRGARRGAPWLGGLFALLFASLVFFALASLFEHVASDPASAAGALALVLGASLVGLVVFDLHYAVAALMLDSDLELLRRAPITPVQLIALKLADVLPRTSALLVVLVLPAIVAFAAVFPLPGWAWALLPLQLVALWAIPLGLGVALALLLLRRVPARRARDVLGLLSTFMITGLWLANSFVLPRLAEEPHGLEGSLAHAARSPLAAWSPSHWMATAVARGAAGDPADAARWTGLLVVVAVIALLVAAVTAASQFDEALARVAAGARPRAAARRRPATVGPRGLVAAIVTRDARLFLRDWTVLSDVLVAAGLWTLLPLAGAPLLTVAPPTLARAMLIALAVGLGYEVAARSVPFERAGLAWARLGPVPPSRWIAGKLAGAAALSLPIFGLACAALAIALPLPPHQWPPTLAVGLAAMGLSLALGLWTGLAFGDPAWTNPRAMLDLSGRLVATSLLLVQAGLWLGWIVLLDWRPLPPIAAFGLPLAAAALLAWAPLHAARVRLRTMEWSG